MKKLLAGFVVVIAAILLYVNYGDQGGTPPGGSAPSVPQAAPSSTATPTPSPPVVAAPIQPVGPQPMPGMVVQPTPPTGAPPMANPRAAEVRQIILQCAQRAGWRIVNYQEQPGATVRVTGVAVNDNTRNQRFIDEIQRSGIIRDFQNGPSRVFTDQRGQTMMENTFIIKWQ